MSLWQIFAAINGHAEAHAGKAAGLTETEKDDLFAWIVGPDAAPPEGKLPNLQWDGVRLTLL